MALDLTHHNAITATLYDKAKRMASYFLEVYEDAEKNWKCPHRKCGSSCIPEISIIVHKEEVGRRAGRLCDEIVSMLFSSGYWSDVESNTNGKLKVGLRRMTQEDCEKHLLKPQPTSEDDPSGNGMD